MRGAIPHRVAPMPFSLLRGSNTLFVMWPMVGSMPHLSSFFSALGRPSVWLVNSRAPSGSSTPR